MQEPYRKGNSESILASSLAGDIARCFLKRRQRHRWAGLLSCEFVKPVRCSWCYPRVQWRAIGSRRSLKQPSKRSNVAMILFFSPSGWTTLPWKECKLGLLIFAVRGTSVTFQVGEMMFPIELPSTASYATCSVRDKAMPAAQLTNDAQLGSNPPGRKTPDASARAQAHVQP